MSLMQQGAVLALRQILQGACQALGVGLGEAAVDSVEKFLSGRFTDHSQRLTVALRTANERAWKALEVALAGESFWSWLDPKEDRELRRSLRAFLDALPTEQLAPGREVFRQRCLEELRSARRAGLLQGQPDLPGLAREVAALARYADPWSALQAEEKLLREMAQTLTGHGYRNLGRLLTLRPVQGQSLLALASRHFFRRAVEEDQQLFQGLAWASWQNLARVQEQGFDQLRHILREHGRELDLHLSELQAGMERIHGAVLDIREEQHRQGERHRELYEAVLAVQQRLDRLEPGLAAADPLGPVDESERSLLKSVLARYRGLPEGQQRQLPALLHAVGRLLLRIGEAEEARSAFATVTGVLTDRRALGEAHSNAYRAALRRRDWPRALASFQQAALFDPKTWTDELLIAEVAEALQLPSAYARAFVQKIRADSFPQNRECPRR